MTLKELVALNAKDLLEILKTIASSTHDSIISGRIEEALIINKILSQSEYKDSALELMQFICNPKPPALDQK